MISYLLQRGQSQFLLRPLLRGVLHAEKASAISITSKRLRILYLYVWLIMNQFNICLSTTCDFTSPKLGR